MRSIEFSGLGSFETDATAAMQASPAYFEFWDRWKTIGLLAATAALAYQLGKMVRRRDG